MYQWCGFKSRRGKNKNLTALKSNSNTVWFNFQTYIYIYIYRNWVNYGVLVYETLFRGVTFTPFKIIYISIIYCTCKLKMLYIGPINVMLSYYFYKNCCTFVPTLYNHSWYFVLGSRAALRK